MNIAISSEGSKERLKIKFDKKSKAVINDIKFADPKAKPNSNNSNQNTSIFNVTFGWLKYWTPSNYCKKKTKENKPSEEIAAKCNSDNESSK